MRTFSTTDHELHLQAKIYALRHAVPYVEALAAVVEAGRAAASAQRPVEREAAQLTDEQLHNAALQHAKVNSVSYSEAITAVHAACVSFGGPLQFSEGFAPSQGARLLEQQSIEIFRAGVHLDDQGAAHSFSEADIAGMAASYNPALREAPLTVGHPKDNLPAYGWVKAVARNAAGVLTIKAHQVEPQFAEMVRAGRFKKRSASFYPPHAPNNPLPGKWYLRHVAFLGAQPPALAGLKDIEFS